MNDPQVLIMSTNVYKENEKERENQKEDDRDFRKIDMHERELTHTHSQNENGEEVGYSQYLSFSYD